MTGYSLLCNNCRHPNAKTAAFCEACGSSLPRVCIGCNSRIGPSARFCPSCGKPQNEDENFASGRDKLVSYTPQYLADKILQSKATIEGERKQVTALFVDVRGSMDLAQEVGAEEWHQVMDAFFAISLDVVHRFEGTVNQFTGDGIMALFGAPIAHEDHAVRACHTALTLRDDLDDYATKMRRTRGLNFSVRMGLNSGEVVVGAIGDDLRMDYTALGHTVGLAQRMEQVAEPGTAYLTERTATLIRGLFDVGDLGLFSVKGVEHPVRVYELRGSGRMQTRFQVARASGFSRFVGRDQERAQLEAALSTVLDGGGQVVGVVGEPGVGKSRLCYEFVRSVKDRGIRLLEGRGIAHGQGIPFLPMLQVLRGSLGITEQDTDQQAREKIAGRLLLLDESFKDALPLMFDFLGVPDPERSLQKMDPEARQRQLFGIVSSLTHARAEREPAVVLIEDLHWVDGASQAMIEHLVETLPGTRTLLLLNFRPEYHARWMRRSYYQQLPLQPLDRRAVREMLQALLGANPSIAELAHRVEEKTGGNPFFIEEVIQSLTETGILEGEPGAYRLSSPVDELVIPGTVQAVLSARIDRLPERDKSVLMTAAVIGREFSKPVLAHVSDLSPEDLDAALRSCVDNEFIHEQGVYPEEEYVFKHPLTRETAYHSQLTSRRRRIHAAVADAVEDVYPERLDEWAALLAHHREQADDLLAAARWSRRAAEWAGRTDPVEAAKHWRSVRSLVEKLSRSPEVIELGLAACLNLVTGAGRLGASEEEQLELLALGRELVEQTENKASLAKLLGTYGLASGLSGEMEEAFRYCEEAMRIADSTDDMEARASVRLGLSVARGYCGDLRESLQAAEEALELSRQEIGFGTAIVGASVQVWSHMFRGCWVLTHLGRLEEARAERDTAFATARDSGEIEMLGLTYGLSVHLAWATGETSDSYAHGRRAIEIAEQLGSSYIRSRAYADFGRAALLCGDYKQAIETLLRSLEIARTKRSGLLQEGLTLSLLAEAELLTGRPGAFDTAEQAIAAGRKRKSKLQESLGHLVLAKIFLAVEERDRVDHALRALEEAAHLSASVGANIVEPFVEVERAKALLLRGDHEGAKHSRHHAIKLFMRMGAHRRADELAEKVTTT